MPTLTPATLSGIGVPLPMEADITASTLGQEGPRAGYPEPQEDSLGRRPALVLSATGEQTAGTSIEVATQQAGHVGRGTFRFRRTIAGVVEDTWHGAHLPNALFGAAFPGWSGLTNQATPHAVTLPDDTQIVAYRVTDTPNYNVASVTFDAGTDSYASAVSVVTGLDGSHKPHPALVVIPDPAGSSDPLVLCAYWVADDTENEAQIDIRYTRDQGATWGTWATSVLPAAITINSGSPYYTLGRIRMARIGSQLVLFAHLTSSASVDGEKEHIHQYASGDYGCSWAHIGYISGCGYPDAVSYGAIAYCAYLVIVSTSIIPVIKPIRSAYVLISLDDGTDDADFLLDITDAGTISGSPSVFSYGNLGLCATPAGKLYAVVGRAVSTGERPMLSASYDPATGAAEFGFSTWSGGTAGVRVWWWDSLGTSTEYPLSCAATWYRGQMRVYAVMESGTTDFDDRLTRFDIGGNSSVTLPARFPTGYGTATAWAWTAIPTARHSVFGWTFTGAGSRSITTVAGWETLTTSASAAYYTRTVTASADQQVWQLLRVRVASGGGVSSREVACGIRCAGVGYGYEFELRFSTTQIRFRDIGGAADTTTITIDTSTVGVDVLIACSGAGLASAWAREVGSDEVQTWTAIEEGYQLTDDAGAGGTSNVIMFGNRASGTATSRWIAIGGNAGDSLGSADLASGPLNPQDLRGVPYAREGAYACDGVSLGATSGPALAGDAWVVRPDADYPIRHLIPVGDESSTRDVIGGRRTSATEAASGWRALATSGYVQVRFQDQEDRVFPPILGFHVEGCNAPDPLVRGYSYSGAAYTTLGTASNTRTGLRFSRPSAGSATVRVDTSGTSSTEPYIRSGSLVGSYFRFSVGGKVRPIVANSEGRWSNDGDAAVVVLTLGGIDGTEPTSGTAGTIIYSRFTFLIALPASTAYGAFALQWSSTPDTYEGKPRATVFAPFTVEPLLYAKSWGATLRYEDPAELYESRSGLRRGSLRMRGPRRIWQVPLSALVPQKPLLAPSAWAPSVYKAYSNASYPIAGAYGDEYGKSRGAWLAAYGSRHPLIWLPRIGTASATQTLIGEDAGLYCRVTSPPQYVDEYGRDTGAAWAEVWKGDVWTFEEER